MFCPIDQFGPLSSITEKIRIFEKNELFPIKHLRYPSMDKKFLKKQMKHYW